MSVFTAWLGVDPRRTAVEELMLSVKVTAVRETTAIAAIDFRNCDVVMNSTFMYSTALRALFLC